MIREIVLSQNTQKQKGFIQLSLLENQGTQGTLVKTNSETFNISTRKSTIRTN